MVASEDLSKKFSEIYQCIDDLKSHALNDPDHVEKILDDALKVLQVGMEDSSAEWVTEREKTENALRVSEAKFKGIYESSPIGIEIYGPEGRLIHVNKACMDIFGVAGVEDVSGFSLFGDPNLPTGTRELLLKGEVVKYETTFDFERVKDLGLYRTSKSGVVHILVIVSPLYLEGSSSPSNYLVQVDDITERKRTEEALRASHQLLDGIINAIPVRVFWKDRDLIYLGCNAIFARDAGFADSKDIVGKDDYQMGWRDQAELYRADDRQVIDRGRPKLLIEEPQTTPDGNTIVLLTSKIPLRSSDGKIIGVLGTYMDITERKRAERTLQEQLNFLQQLIDSIPSPIFYKDTKGIYLGCNIAFETLTGFAKDELVGHTVYELYPKDLADIYYEADSKLFQNPGVQVYEAAIAHVDGGRRDVMFSKATYFDTEGRLAGLVGVILDITERKNMENALRESERRLANIIDFLPDSTLVIDKEGTVIAWNHAIEDLTGVKAEDMLGKGNYEHALSFYGQRRPILIDLVLRPHVEVERAYSNLERKEDTLVGESYMPNLGEGQTYLLGVAAALYDSKGNIVGAIESIKDITDRKRSEDLLKASLQEKEVLLKEVYHRVKNNLQIISSMLNIQASYIHDEDTRNVLAESRSRVKSMALIHESLYRSESLARVNFADYIRNLIKALFSSYNVDKKRIRHNLNLEEVLLEIDQAIPCGLILNELVTNCLKHAFPEGRNGEIQIELLSLNDMVVLAVKDNGIGLPKGFEPKSTKSMGLKIVHMLVKQLKGSLEINPSKGTEFRITFPRS